MPKSVAFSARLLHSYSATTYDPTSARVLLGLQLDMVEFSQASRIFLVTMDSERRKQFSR